MIPLLIIHFPKSGCCLNCRNLRKEAEYYEMSDVERREKDRQFGKFVKNAIKDLKKYKDN